MVRAEMTLVLEVQIDEYWQDIDAWTLEQMRRRLRALIKLIEGEAQKIVYTDFADEMGEAAATIRNRSARDLYDRVIVSSRNRLQPMRPRAGVQVPLRLPK